MHAEARPDGKSTNRARVREKVWVLLAPVESANTVVFFHTPLADARRTITCDDGPAVVNMFESCLLL